MPEDDILSSGFNIVNEHNGIVMGDYSDYTTIYRKLDNTVELSNDGSVYITPVIPEPIIPEPYVPNEEKLQEKFENEKKYKIMELSDYCQSMICSGVDVGEKHYSYTLQDQANLENAINVASMTGLKTPYHADGESCELYSLNQLQEIYITEQVNLTKHQTYFNQLKRYITDTFTDRNMLSDLQEITYGFELTGSYLDAYNTIINQSALIVQTIMGNANEVSE